MRIRDNERYETDVATVPTACGIETFLNGSFNIGKFKVATVPTACGIETFSFYHIDAFTAKLQQCLPLAVLKQYNLY